MSTRRRRRRRRVTYRTAMKKATEIREWLKAPHWTWWLAWRAYLAAVVLTWFGVHHLFPNLTFEAVLILGPAAPVVAVATWFGLTFAERLVRRIRQTTEAGIPLSPVRMTRDLVSERKRFVEAEDRWALAMRAQKVAWDGQSPKLHRMQQTALGEVKAHINPAGLGGDLVTIRRMAADGVLAGIMGCKEVSIHETKPGRGWITFHQSPPLERPFSVADMPASGELEVSFGKEASATAAKLPLGINILAGGSSNSGKSGFGWDLFFDIVRKGIPTQLWLIDPKFMELAVFKPLVGKRIGNIEIMGYCNTADEAAALFKEFEAELHVRQEAIGPAFGRKLTHPTEEFRARYIWTDEALDIAECWKVGMKSSAGIILSQGRATWDFMVMMTQIGQLQELGSIRKGFQLRVCFRTGAAEDTKAILGVDESKGVPCSEIPFDQPGVGYYVTDSGARVKFRAAHVTDADIDALLHRGELPSGMLSGVAAVHTGPPCFTYVGRDRKGQVMYVGIAGGYEGQRHPVARRRAEHRRNDVRWCAEHERAEYWWRVHVVDTRLEVRKHPSRAAALIAEERLIKELRPRFNLQHNSDNPLSNLNLARRAGWRRRTVDAVGEYRQWGREHRVARRAQLAAAHQERVARLQEERERFVQTVTERAA